LRRLIAPLAIVATLLAAEAGAYTFNDAKIDQWVGTGAKSAVIVVDFGTASYAFGLNWNDVMNSRLALETIAANTTLQVEIGPKWGMVNGIGYAGHYLYSDTDEYDPTAWGWNYFTSSDGKNWDLGQVAATSRILTNGSWDGWVWAPPWPQVATPPVTPTVPEPASLSVLCSMIGLAGSFKLLRLRR